MLSGHEVATGPEREPWGAGVLTALGDARPVAFGVPRGGIDRIGHVPSERFATVGQP
jgi:hypothetical protein